MVTDPAGRLRRLTAVPVRADATGTAPASPDWEALFEHAGLDMDQFRSVTPRELPPVFADRRGAWEGAIPGGRLSPVRIEAAAYAGRPVYFDVIEPWMPDAPAGSTSPFGLPVVLLFIIVLAISLLLARRNLKLGRADRQGAFRTAAIVGIAALAGIGLLTRDASDFVPVVGRGRVIAYASTFALAYWMLYMAFEPYVRRLWPEMLVGWSRLLAGRLRDPLVGRDLLFGVLGGVIVVSVCHLRFLIPAWAGLAPPMPTGPPEVVNPYALWLVMGGQYLAAAFPLSLGDALARGFLIGAVLVLLALLLRGRLRAAVALVLLTAITQPLFEPWHPLADIAFTGTVIAIGIVWIVRFGVLAFTVHLIPYFLLGAVALRFDGASPYVASSYLVVGVVAALALYGFFTALGGRSIFGDGDFERLSPSLP